MVRGDDVPHLSPSESVMAGDWIKMRVDLQSHPKVVRILSATCTDKFRVIGGLHAVWTIFDTHSEDGKLKGYTPEALDHVIGWDGFSRAMEAVGWLVYDGLETLAMPEFGSHNGKSGKRRAEDQKRKQDARESVRNLSANCPTEMRTREEKSRDIKAIEQQAARKTSNRFAEFWKVYPMKKGKADAEAKWKAKGYDAIADTIIADVVKRCREDRQWLDGYAPHGSTYINARGWEDEIERRKEPNGHVPDYMVNAL